MIPKHCTETFVVKTNDVKIILILCLGGYTRLPRCIKERIIPPPPISALEKRLTLLKLNQVIEYRLVNSAVPLQMRNLKVGFILQYIRLERIFKFRGKQMIFPNR